MYNLFRKYKHLLLKKETFISKRGNKRFFRVVGLEGRRGGEEKETGRVPCGILPARVYA